MIIDTKRKRRIMIIYDNDSSDDNNNTMNNIKQNNRVEVQRKKEDNIKMKMGINNNRQDDLPSKYQTIAIVHKTTTTRPNETKLTQRKLNKAKL